jgi:hypothetical protein
VTRTRVLVEGKDRTIVGDEKITMTRDEHATIVEDDNGMRLIMNSVVEQQWVSTNVTKIKVDGHCTGGSLIFRNAL